MSDCLRVILEKIVTRDELHAKWLNTLSYLENCGARKIAACEHPTLVKEEMLKHASEEFRHSHYLKKQIKKVTAISFPSYSIDSILGALSAICYLNKLDLLCSRFLRSEGIEKKSEIKKMSYLLVTYAIELRARELYPLYEEILRKHQSAVYVKSIILEEEEHLEEMEEGLARLEKGKIYAEKICLIEKTLFEGFMANIERQLLFS